MMAGNVGRESPIAYDPAAADFPERMYEIYRVLRDAHPVWRDEMRGTWLVTRYADVRAVALDPDRFSSEDTSISIGLLPMLPQMDPPRHDQLRTLVSRAFTPRRIADLESTVRRIVRELLDGAVVDGRCDLLRQLATPVPSRVVGDLIGIPADRRADFVEWTEALLDADPARRGGENPFPAIYAEFERLLDERRREPQDDLMSALIAAEVDGQGLSQDELLGFCTALIIAGNDTTTNLIANGAVLLAQHPNQREMLARAPELLPRAIEEMLRFESPVQALPRSAVVDVEVHGTTIAAGDEVSLVWGAANRDERRFPAPDRFDVGREDNEHLAFGYGKHFCIGASLARLEARVVFEELLARMPEYMLAETPVWHPSLWARALRRVPVRVAP